MSVLRSFSRGVAAVALAASPLAAQERLLFDWTGTVDRDVQLVMRGRDVRVRASSYHDRRDVDRGARVQNALPKFEGVVTVRLADGRGRVDVIQQPDEINDYTAILRVRDVRSGDDQYRVLAYWEPLEDEDRYERGNNGVGNGPWGNGRGVDNRRVDEARTAGFRIAAQWRGLVDDVVEVRVQGDRIETRTLSGQQNNVLVANAGSGGLPRRNVEVRIEQEVGRGTVTIVEQPSPRNGFTTVIRVSDRLAGASLYDFNLVWR
jgi:hypothetical protein